MITKHPSYGLLSFSRITSNVGKSLFGSSIKHRDLVRMRLKRAYVDRKLNQDWYHEDGTIIEIDLSLSQFAEVITSMNMEPGVPVTLRYTETEGDIPECSFENKAEQHKKEYKERLQRTYATSISLAKNLEEFFKTKKSLTKKDKEEILSKLHMIQNDLVSNQAFQMSQFQEQMEKTVLEAKGEIEAYYQNRLTGIAELDNKISSVYIEMGEDNND